MRRAFPQKVKPVSCDSSGSQAASEQPKQSSEGIARKARTSAAMIGLALSMGASSLLIPRHDDRASAAEPQHVDSEVMAAPVESELTPLEPISEVSVPEARSTPASVGDTFSHRVTQGQTLRSIARQYRVPLRSLASANGVSSSALIRVGQTIRIPALPAALSALRESRSVASLPQINFSSEDSVLKGSTSSSLSDIVSPSDGYEANASDKSSAQNLSRLRLQRDRLRSSLAGLKHEESEHSTGSSKAVSSLNQDSGSESFAELSRRPALEIADSVPSEAGSVYHVKPGDTLGAIAQAYDVPQRVLQAVNQLNDPNVLRINQPLLVPQTTAATVNTYTAATDRSPGLASNQGISSFSPVDVRNRGVEPTIAHRVTFGETLAQIAQESGVSKDSLIQANRIGNPDVIRVGQLIQIPGVTSVVSVAEAGSNTPIVEASENERSLLNRSFGGTNPSVVSPSASILPASGLVGQPTVPGIAYPVMPGASASQPVGAAIFSTEFVSVDLARSSAPTYPTVPGGVQPSQESSVQSTDTGRRSYSNLQRLMDDVASMRRYVESRTESKASSNQSAADVQQSLTVAAAPQLPTVPASDMLQNFAPVDVSASELEAPSADSVSPSPSPTVSVPVEQSTEVTQPASSAGGEAPQLVAAAPLGSENYSPLLEPLIGRMVSPELPALAGAEAFLPQGSATFNGYIWPARGVLTSGYGWRWGRMHRGIDVAAPVGTPVVAAAAGVVQSAGWNSGGFGNLVDIRHPDGSLTRYAHNSRLLVRVGQEVAQGEQIAAMGSTGYSTGPHVHFEIHLPSQGAVNPSTHLARR